MQTPEIVLNDVILPSWSENNIGIFTAKMRNFMENNSKDINKWIDLIFGLNQKGANAESNNNLFMSYSYERMVKIEEVKDFLKDLDNEKTKDMLYFI